jgi:hypothetical protein
MKTEGNIGCCNLVTEESKGSQVLYVNEKEDVNVVIINPVSWR